MKRRISLLLLKEDLTEKDICLLNELGFSSEGSTTYSKKYGADGFQVILNPVIPNGYLKVVIGYMNENIEENYLDEVANISPIYEDITFLYYMGILIKESE